MASRVLQIDAHRLDVELLSILVDQFNTVLGSTPPRIRHLLTVSAFTWCPSSVDNSAHWSNIHIWFAELPIHCTGTPQTPHTSSDLTGIAYILWYDSWNGRPGTEIYCDWEESISQHIAEDAVRLRDAARAPASSVGSGAQGGRCQGME